MQANDLKIIRLNATNFNEHSLNDFQLKQQVTHCWRNTDGAYRLTPVSYTEDWDKSERKSMAKKILTEMQNGGTAFGAIQNQTLIGFALLSKRLFGKTNQYADLTEFYVSEPFRRQGIGKLLFEEIKTEAIRFGAKKLYISAHSAEESIAAYKKYGCKLAEEPNAAHVEKEPYDLQLEYELFPCIYAVDNKEKYLHLLLLADEQKEMIARYLPQSTMYVIDDDGIKGEIVVTDFGNRIIEIKNLAVLPEFQRRGYGKKLVDYVCQKYKNDFKFLQVGTGISPLTVPFYEKCGFTKSHVVKNFFTENYDHPIYEGGVLLKDMIYLKKRL